MLKRDRPVDTYSVFMQPTNFGRSTTGEPPIYRTAEGTVAPPGLIPLNVLDSLQADLYAPAYSSPRLDFVVLAPEATGPLADRADLPLHERRISAAAYSKLKAGIEDVRAGRVRIVSPDELAPSDDE
jgi:hypothetical protein